MLFSCTLKDGIAYVPTVVKTEAGFYMQAEPVAVIPAGHTAALRHALHAVMAKGNEIVPTPKRNAYPAPVLPKYAGANNWSVFKKGSSEWSIREENANYQIIPYRNDPHGSETWIEDNARKIKFSPGTTREQVIDRMIGILQDAAGK
jgi:hypothetical protein